MINRDIAALSLRAASLWICTQAVVMTLTSLVSGVGTVVSRPFGGWEACMPLFIMAAIYCVIGYASLRFSQSSTERLVAIADVELPNCADRAIGGALAAALAIYGVLKAFDIVGLLYVQWDLFAESDYTSAEWLALPDTKYQAFIAAFDLVVALMFIFAGREIVAAVLWAKTPRQSDSDVEATS